MIERLRSLAAPARALVMIVPIVVIGLAWVLGAAPSSAPDEDSHYVRMVGLSSGDVTGDDVPPDAPIPWMTEATAAQRERINREAGVYRIADADLPAQPCNKFQPHRPFVCPPPVADPGHRATSYHAKSLPTAYIVPAMLSRLGSGSARMYLGRLGFLLQACALLWIAFVASDPVLRRSLWASGCAVVAVTPLVVYQFGVLSLSGAEAAAVMAFGASLWRAVTSGARRWRWAASLLCALAILVRDTGFVIVPLVGVVIVLASPGLVGRLRKAGAGRVVPLAVLPVAALAASMWWRSRYQMTLPVTIGALTDTFTLRQFARLAYDSVGRVGWLDTYLHPLGVAVWFAAAAPLVVGAMWSSGRAIRLGVGFLAAWVVFNTLLTAALSPSGFGNGARYSLPILSAGLLSVGLVASDALPTPSRRRLVCVAVAIVAAVHAVVVLTAARRSALGQDGLDLSLSGALWTPPVGWPVVLVLGAVGSAGLAATAWLVQVDTHSPPPPR